VTFYQPRRCATVIDRRGATKRATCHHVGPRGRASTPGRGARSSTSASGATLRSAHPHADERLQAKAGAAAALRSAVTRLDRAWLKLRPDVVRSGGARVAAKFDAHVKRMQRLAAAGNRSAGKEAQHGLDLVDDLEAVYDR
jgi:hypothetical protein